MTPLFYHSFSHFFINSCSISALHLLMSCPLCSSAACVCGTEKWSDRRREWTDVTVSRCRSSQTLTHFHSAHHKRPAVFICLGAAVLAVGVWRYSGVGFHCLLFDVRPPSVCVCVCHRVYVCNCEGMYSYVWFCTAQKWNQCSLTAPSSLFQP